MPGYDESDLTDFEALDDNGNGRIDRVEWNGTRAVFTRLDVNRDGVLSRRELAANDVMPAAGDEFDAFDVNNNGVLSRGEWRGNYGTFSSYDRNRDDVISRQDTPSSTRTT